MALSSDHVVETLGSASEENHIDPMRYSQVVNLPTEGEVWVAGDIHDYRRNFDKLMKAADLENHPHRHLVLQELIHGEHFDADGSEESWSLLHRAAELKSDYSDQVHFLLANHDLAQIHGKGIMKGSISVCEAFNKGVKKAFGSSAGVGEVGIHEFFVFLPLGDPLHNGMVFCSNFPAGIDILPLYLTGFGPALSRAGFS